MYVNGDLLSAGFQNHIGLSCVLNYLKLDYSVQVLVVIMKFKFGVSANLLLLLQIS